MPGSLPYLLRTRRRFPLLPHRFLLPIRAMLAEASELAFSIGSELSPPDARWLRAGAALQRAAESLDGVG